MRANVSSIVIFSPLSLGDGERGLYVAPLSVGDADADIERPCATYAVPLSVGDGERTRGMYTAPPTLHADARPCDTYAVPLTVDDGDHPRCTYAASLSDGDGEWPCGI